MMSTVVRTSLNTLETYWRQQRLSNTRDVYYALAIVRSAFDLKQENTARVRRGVALLIQQVLRLEPSDLVPFLNNGRVLLHFGVVRPGEKPLTIITPITNYLRRLHLPLASASDVAA